MNTSFTRILLLATLCGCAALSGCHSDVSGCHPEPCGRAHEAYKGIAPRDVNGLRSVLAQYDRQIAALRSTLKTPGFGDSTAQINESISALRSGIAQSASDVNSLIAQKAQVYAAREDRAVSSLLADARVSAP